jgi:mercuric ion binding protein
MIKTIITVFLFTLALSANERNHEIELKVDGIGCPYCSMGFIEHIHSLREINDINIDYETGTFTFTMPGSESISVEALQKSVIKAGYTLITAKILFANGKKSEFTKVD